MNVVVETRNFYRPEAESRLDQLARRSDEIFRRQPGFVALRRYRAVDGCESLTLIEWESLDAHLACQSAPDWGPLWPTWQELLANGDLRFEMRVLAVQETAPHS